MALPLQSGHSCPQAAPHVCVISSRSAVPPTGGGTPWPRVLGQSAGLGWGTWGAAPRASTSLAEEGVTRAGGPTSRMEHPGVRTDQEAERTWSSGNRGPAAGPTWRSPPFPNAASYPGAQQGQDGCRTRVWKPETAVTLRMQETAAGTWGDSGEGQQAPGPSEWPPAGCSPAGHGREPKEGVCLATQGQDRGSLQGLGTRAPQEDELRGPL